MGLFLSPARKKGAGRPAVSGADDDDDDDDGGRDGDGDDEDDEDEEANLLTPD